jgi:hypothetical protein
MLLISELRRPAIKTLGDNSALVKDIFNTILLYVC